MERRARLGSSRVRTSGVPAAARRDGVVGVPASTPGAPTSPSPTADARSRRTPASSAGACCAAAPPRSCSPARAARARDTAELAGLARPTASTTGSSSGTTASTRAAPPPRSARPARLDDLGGRRARRRDRPSRWRRAPTPCSPTSRRRSTTGDVVLVGHGHFSRVLLAAGSGCPSPRARTFADGRRGLGGAGPRARRRALPRARQPAPSLAMIASTAIRGARRRGRRRAGARAGRVRARPAALPPDRRASSTPRCSARRPRCSGTSPSSSTASARRVRALVPQLLDLARGARDLPRGPLRAARAPRRRDRPRAARARWPRCAPSGGSAGWSGRCSTGTPRRSASTARSAPSRWTSGRCSGSTARARCARPGVVTSSQDA